MSKPLSDTQILLARDVNNILNHLLAAPTLTTVTHQLMSAYASTFREEFTRKLYDSTFGTDLAFDEIDRYTTFTWRYSMYNNLIGNFTELLMVVLSTNMEPGNYIELATNKVDQNNNIDGYVKHDGWLNSNGFPIQCKHTSINEVIECRLVKWFKLHEMDNKTGRVISKLVRNTTFNDLELAEMFCDTLNVAQFERLCLIDLQVGTGYCIYKPTFIKYFEKFVLADETLAESIAKNFTNSDFIIDIPAKFFTDMISNCKKSHKLEIADIKYKNELIQLVQQMIQTIRTLE